MAERVRVHRNLHKAKQGGAQWVLTRGGKVQRYVDALTIENVSTRIQEGGRRRCQREQVRNVCGFLDGDTAAHRRTTGDWRRIGFDPRKDKAFLAEGEAWNKAAAVVLESDGSAWALQPTWVGKPNVEDQQKEQGV